MYLHCRYKCLVYDGEKKSKKAKRACSFIRNLRVCIEKENYKHLAVVAWPLTLRAESASRSAITILCILSTKKWPVMKKSINMRSMQRHVALFSILLFYISIKLPQPIPTLGGFRATTNNMKLVGAKAGFAILYNAGQGS